MSLTTIQTAVWDMLLEEGQSPTAADDVSLLAALNHARLDAERKMDWVASESVGYVTIPATTGALLSATKAGYTVGVGPSGSALDIKQIRWARTFENGTTWCPAKVQKQSTYEALLVRGDRENNSWWPIEDPVQAWSESRLPETRNLLLLDGLSIYTLRASSVDARLHCYTWLSAYTSFTAPDDFLITKGEDYLMWSAILQMNVKRGVFLPRNEGSLTEEAISGRKESAWESLLLWDSGLKNQNDYILA